MKNRAPLNTPWMAVVLIVLALALAGCGGKTTPVAAPPPKSEPAAQATEKPSDSAGTETTEADPTAEPEATESADAVTPTAASDDTLSVTSRGEGLDKLKSYHMSWKAEWKSTESGKTDSGNWDWVEEYSSDPKALHFIWKGTGSGADAKQTVMEIMQVGNTMYMLNTEGDKVNCTSFSSDDQSQMEKGIFSPNSLGSVNNARYVNTEDVNGVKAKHYKYDEKSANLAGFGKLSGEMWVAVDGGFVVKDIMQWEGGAGLFGSSTTGQGTGQWAWELSQVNQPVEIKAPENCGGGANKMPMMADASEKASIGDMVTYKTASKIADVTAFYQKEMAAAGWQPEGEPTTTDEMAMLQFAKDSQKASVTITTDGDKTSVMVSVTK
jgi:hypothetical protein